MMRPRGSSSSGGSRARSVGGLRLCLWLLAACACLPHASWAQDCSGISSGCTACVRLSSSASNSGGGREAGPGSGMYWGRRGLLQDGGTAAAVPQPAASTLAVAPAGAGGAGVGATPQASATSNRRRRQGRAPASPATGGSNGVLSGGVGGSSSGSVSSGSSGSGSGSGGSAPSGSSQRPRRQRRQTEAGNGFSWGWGNPWSHWSSSGMNCTACDAAGNYALLTPRVGTTRCGCMPGYGVVPTGNQTKTSAWMSTYVQSFTCAQCANNTVPLLPGSNLRAVWSGSSWSLMCTGNTSSSGSGSSGSSSGSSGEGAPPAPNTGGVAIGGVRSGVGGRLPGRPRLARPGSAAGAASAGRLPVAGGSSQGAAGTGSRRLQQAAAAPTAASARAAAARGGALRAAVAGPASTSVAAIRARQFFTAGVRERRDARGKFVASPWWPGQCVDCALAGGVADPTGTFCMCNGGGGGGPPPPPGPPPPSPPPPPPGGACITCDTSVLAAEITSVCGADALGSIYLSDNACTWSDTGVTDVMFATTPNVIDTTNDFTDEVSCALLSPQQGSSLQLVAAINGSGLSCGALSSTYNMMVPAFQGGGNSPSPAPQPSPSPPPEGSPPPPPPPASPSPPPPPPPPPPPSSPSPPPPGGNACVVCSAAQLEAMIASDCPALDEIDVWQACNFDNMGPDDTIAFVTTPDVSSASGPDYLSCAKLAGMPGGTFSVSWAVTVMAGSSCSPPNGSISVTVPGGSASPAPSPPPPPSSPAPPPQSSSPAVPPPSASPPPSPAPASPSPSPSPPTSPSPAVPPSPSMPPSPAPSSPSPPPPSSPSPPPPSSPSPPPPAAGCVVCDVSLIQAAIQTACTADPNTGNVYLWDSPDGPSPCTSADANVKAPLFYTTPDVLFDAPSEILDCSMLVSGTVGGPYTVLRPSFELRTVVDLVFDPKATCLPLEVNYTVTVPPSP